MTNIKPDKPSPLELDALAETSNIGMGHAAVHLSRMMQREVVLEVPNLRILDPRQISPPFASEEAVGLSLEIEGGVCGSLLILLPTPYALHILAPEADRSAPRTLDAAELAPLAEGGKRIAAAYLDAVGGLLKLPLSPSSPILECGGADAIADAALERARALDPPLIMQTVFSVPGISGEGRILLIPGAAGVEVILAALGTR